MKLTILIELHKDDSVPSQPLIDPEAIEMFKQIHPTLQSIGVIVVRKDKEESIKTLAFPESSFFPKSRFKKDDL